MRHPPPRPRQVLQCPRTHAPPKPPLTTPTVKVRLQTRVPDAPQTTISTFSYILRNEGPLGLYAGLTAALLRQLTYSTIRFGVYEDLKVRFAPAPNPSTPNKPSQPSLPRLILLSSFSGLLGGIAGNPGDVLNVRMQSDASLPTSSRRNYNNALDGLLRMIREEGLSSLFRGVSANASRALLMNSSQLASYDAFKHMFLTNPLFHFPDTIATHFLSSLLAGFVATTICSPVDVVKSRIMSMSTEGGKATLMGMIAKAQREEGLLWMFRGWVPSFIRLGPQTVFTMLFFEQHKKWWRQWRKGDAGERI